MRLVVAVVAFLAACSGDGDGKSNIDAPKVFEDAPPPMIDAPPPVMGLGQPCTPVMGNPQADCPTGFECLDLNGGTGDWCSKTCTRGAGDTCGMGYMGPGLAQCIFDITNGNMTRQFCGIICTDMTGSCPAAKCNGMCPTPLACSANLMNMSGMVTGKACF